MSLDHIGFTVADFAKSKAFYLAALAPIGMAVVSEGDDWALFGRHMDRIDLARQALDLTPGPAGRG